MVVGNKKFMLRVMISARAVLAATVGYVPVLASLTADADSLNEQVFKIAGKHSFDSPNDNNFLIYYSSIEDYLNFHYTLFSREAIVELSWDRTLSLEAADVILESVSCNHMIIPGNGLVVIQALKRSQYSYRNPDIIMRVNRSNQLKDFIKANCGEKPERLDSSISVSLEVFRRRFLAINRTIKKVQPANGENCSAYVFTEFKSDGVLSKFYVERCIISPLLNTCFLYLARLPVAMTETSQSCSDWFCSMLRGQQLAEPARLQSTLFYTLLKDDDWFNQLNRNIPYTLQKIINAPKRRGFQFIHSL